MARQTPNLKTAPCGASTAGTPQQLEGWVAGATVTVEFTETINHPSHYRVALSRTGESAFTDPENEDDKTTDGIDLLDGIEDTNDMNNGKLTVEVKLPDEPCENCVLQLLQYMYDKPATPFYYNCADVVIGEGEGGGDGVGGSDAGGVGGADATGTGGEDGADTGGAPSGLTGGSSNGGMPSAGGSVAAAGGASSMGGGPSSTGGLVSIGGSAGGSIEAAGGSAAPPDDDAGGGGCSVGLAQPAAPWAWLLAGLAGLGLNRVRRRSSKT